MKFVMPIQGKTSKELYDMNRNGIGGFYPIGNNNSYHGGVHFEGKKLPVVAITDGTIIAYRYNSKYVEEISGGKTYKYSNSFVLIRHQYKTPKGQEVAFYSHYNHLSPWDELTATLKSNGDKYPHIIIKPGYKIKHDGLDIRSSAEEIKAPDNRIGKFKKGDEVIASPVSDKPDWAKVEGADKYFSCKPIHADSKPVVCKPKFDQIVKCDIPISAGTIIGYTGLYQSEGAPQDYYVTHVDVFAGNDAEDFIKNSKQDGKPSLLKIVKNKEFYCREKVYPDPLSSLTTITRIEGTEVEVTDEGDGLWVRVKDKRLAGRVSYMWLIDKYETLPKSKGHYTADNQDIDKLKEKFPGIDIVGEDWTFENESTETSATKFYFYKKEGNDRIILVDPASSAAEYWVKLSSLSEDKKGKKHLNTDISECWSDNPDKAVFICSGVIPFDCVLSPGVKVEGDNKSVWHKVNVDDTEGWVKESDAMLVSPFDWSDCGFSILKEESDYPWDPTDKDSKIDYDNIPEFFRKIFEQIDTNRNRLVEYGELRAAMSKPEVAYKLSRLICYHCSEWADAGFYNKLYDYVNGKSGQVSADDIKNRIKQMCWWNKVDSIPDRVVYHWHPVAFVEQMIHIHATTTIVWGAKVSLAFKRKVIEIASELEIDPNYLMAAMAWESAETFSPSILNGANSGAVGLIQFMPKTALKLNTTTEKLKSMSAEEQLDYVRMYFLDYKGRCKTLEDVYMAILWPLAIGKPNDYVLFREGTKTYSQNIGIDRNKDGKGTKAEAASCVRDKLERGRLFEG